jgi:hypothetical protein
MMKFLKSRSVPEHELTQYLLGNLQGEKCERLDELSVADDEFAQRLCAAENELVDAYVRHQLRSDALRDFESHYLATDVRRRKVAMARALLSSGDSEASSEGAELPSAQPNGIATSNPHPGRWAARLRFAWLPLTAVLALSTTTAWLALENFRLRRQDRLAQTEHSALEEELRQLRAQAQNEHAVQGGQTPTAAQSEPQNNRHLAQLVSTISLSPTSRGAAIVPAASLSRSDRWLRLQLTLESEDFSEYSVQLLDPGDHKYVWHSGHLKSTDVNHRPVLQVLLPIAGLKNQRYAAEVTGLTPGGRSEVLGSYVFRIAPASLVQNERR